MAKKLKHTLKVTYKLDRIITGEFSFKLPNNRTVAEDFIVNYIISPIITSTIKTEKVYIRLNVKGTIVELNEEVVSTEILFVFTFKDLKNYVIVQDSMNLFKEEYQPIVVNMISTCISTTRGILLEKLSGTILFHKFVPLIDANVFFVKEPK